MSKYTDYKKRRIINFKSRIQELEDEIVRLKEENAELRVQLYLFKNYTGRSSATP
jgi:hypothetical protein